MRVRLIALATTLLLALSVSGKAAAQKSLDISMIDFSQPEFAHHLINGQHERVEIQGLGGLYYGLGAYIKGVTRCPALLQRSVASFKRLSEPAVLGLYIRMFELDLKAREANDVTEWVASAIEGPVLFFAMSAAMSFGMSDVEALVSARNCQAPETVRFVSAAEKLAEALLVVSEQGEKPYKRPASLAGLPEETQRLYDEYYLCRVRTRTFYMVPGGITDPCDDDFFAFNVSEATATGKPAPTRSFTRWQSSQGVVGKYEEHPIGISIVIDAAPEDFTPKFTDSLFARIGAPCVDCGASTDGWLVGGTIQFQVNHDVGRRDRIWNVTLLELGYSNWTNRPWLLRCDYGAGDRYLTRVNYWFRSKPEASELGRLSNLARPLPTIIGVREQCPVTLAHDPVDFSGALPLIESKSKVYNMQTAFADRYCKYEGRTDPACANFIAFIYGKSEPSCFDGLVIPAAPNPPQVISCWYASLADENMGRSYVFWYERTPGNLDAHWVHGKYQLSQVIPVAVTQCPGDDVEAHNLSLRAPPMNQASSTSVSYTLPAPGEPSPCDVVLEAPSAEVPMAFAEVPMAFAEGDYAPVDRVTPVYPARALSRGLEGYVDMSFTVTEIGAVKEPIITFSTSSLFDRAATRAVLKYKYKPRVVDGQPIEVKGVTTRITFESEE